MMGLSLIYKVLYLSNKIIACRKHQIIKYVLPNCYKLKLHLFLKIVRQFEKNIKTSKKIFSMSSKETHFNE